MRRIQWLALVLVAAAGCTDREAVQPVDTLPTTPPQLQGVAYLEVSDLTPAAGDTLVVTANVGISDSLSVASFRARLAYDARGLAYVGEVQLPGILRVVNAQRAGEVIVGGASGQPSPDGKLLSLRFRVVDPAALRSLVLTVDELNDANFGSQLAAIRRAPELLLDRSLGVKR